MVALVAFLAGHSSGSLEDALISLRLEAVQWLLCLNLRNVITYTILAFTTENLWQLPFSLFPEKDVYLMQFCATSVVRFRTYI